MRAVMWMCGLALAFQGCAPRGTLSGRWVFLASGAPLSVGQANTPSAGGPIQLLPGSPAAGACLPLSEYVSAFGPPCEHEPEGGPPGSEQAVRWYCHGQLTVRVRFEACPNPERFRVVEMAVSTVEPTQ